MSSLLTNVSAMSALRSLTATQKALTGTEKQVSTGLRVADASDNAAYWSISTTMRSHVGGLSAVHDALSLTNSIADVTAAALKTVIASTQAIQKDLVTAQQPGVNPSQVQADIAAQQNAIKQAASSASFNGVNWLVGSDAFVTNIDETETYDTDYATYRSILNHTALPSTESNATVSYSSSVTKTDANGNSSSVSSSYGGNVRFYNVYYFHPTISGSTSGALLPDYTMVPTSMSASGAAFSRIETGAMQLFTSSTNTTTINHTASWTDRTVHDNQTDVFTEISDPTVENGAGIFGGSIGFSTGTSSLLGMDISAFTTSDLKAASDAVSTALKSLIGASTSVAGIQNQMDIQAEFNSALSDAFTAGYGSLVDADMNVASTRLQALQTQQQLGIQALSIANDNSQQILKLFG